MFSHVFFSKPACVLGQAQTKADFMTGKILQLGTLVAIVAGIILATVCFCIYPTYVSTWLDKHECNGLLTSGTRGYPNATYTYTGTCIYKC